MVWLLWWPSEQLCMHHDHASHVPQDSIALERDMLKVSCACAQGLLACACPGSRHVTVREVPRRCPGVAYGGHPAAGPLAGWLQLRAKPLA